MAAVQDLVHWLKSRRQRKRKDKDTKTTTDESTELSSSKLSSRVGIALPPTPPPGFVNWPDVSRNCAQSPYHMYDEIPAYAIDTQLDIVREARFARAAQRETGTRTQDCQPYLVVPVKDESSKVPRPRHAKQEISVGSHENIEEFWRERTDNHGDRVPQRGTPWHQFRDGDISSPPPYRPRQGQEGEQRESFDKLTVVDVNPEVLRQQIRHENQHGHQNWNTTGHLQSQKPGLHSDNRKERDYPHNFELGIHSNGYYYSSEGERVDSVSDDSGVSSPSNTPSNMCQSRDFTRDRAQGRRTYVDTPHPGYLGNKPAATSTPTELGYHGDHHDSTDTYNEYDGSEPEVASTDRSAHLQYLFYLRKTEENLQKTSRVQNIARVSTSSTTDVTESQRDSSLDLTSVTELSDMSAFFSDEEVYRLMRQSIKDQERRITRTCSKSAPSERDPSKCESKSKQVHSVPPSTDSGYATSQSAFRPYMYTSQSQSHNCGFVNSNTDAFKIVASEVKEQKEMSLEERLSCRVTTGIPARLRTVSRTQTSHANRSRPVSGLVTMATAHSSNTPKNSVLSDIMRINYDRQILSLV